MFNTSDNPVYVSAFVLISAGFFVWSMIVARSGARLERGRALGTKHNVAFVLWLGALLGVFEILVIDGYSPMLSSGVAFTLAAVSGHQVLRGRLQHLLPMLIGAGVELLVSGRLTGTGLFLAGVFHLGLKAFSHGATVASGTTRRQS